MYQYHMVFFFVHGTLKILIKKWPSLHGKLSPHSSVKSLNFRFNITYVRGEYIIGCSIYKRTIFHHTLYYANNLRHHSNDITKTDFPKLAEKLSVIWTDRHENLVRPKNILPVRKKSPKKFTVTCIMFSLAFLEWFTLVYLWFL